MRPLARLSFARTFSLRKLAFAITGWVSDTAKERAVLAPPLDEPAVITFGADGESRAAAADQLIAVGGVFVWQVLAAHAARAQCLAAKTSVLASVEGASLFGGLCQHTTTAFSVAMFCNSRCAELCDFISRVLDQLAHEDR